MSRLFSYWGKAQGGWHLLPYHCLDVASCAVELLRARADWRRHLEAMTGMSGDALERWVGFFAAIHDLGKWSGAFQGQDRARWVAEALGQGPTFPHYTVRHDALGWVLWRQRLAARYAPDGRTRRRLDVWMRCATGHHGQPPSLLDKGILTNIAPHFSADDERAADDWVEFCMTHFAPDLTLGNEAQFEAASWWLAGFFTAADWLGSGVNWFPYRHAPTSLAGYWVEAQTRAQLAVRESGLGVEAGPRLPFATLFPGYAPSPLQALADANATDEPFLAIIESETGSGKTEAALALAGGHSFFFGLPTQATANGLWQRIAGSPRLARQAALSHSRRWLVPAAMGYAEAWITDSSRRSLLADVAVGTIDQAILAVLYARFASLRLLGLLGKTIVIDEAHAYDPYQRELLCRLVERCAQGGGSVVILSATLPRGHRQTYAAAWSRGRGTPAPELRSLGYPLFTQVRDSHTQETRVRASYDRTIAIEHQHDMRVVDDRLIEVANAGGCAVWIRSTVRDAIETYDRLSARTPLVSLFHARFTAADRANIEQSVLVTFGKKSTPAMRAGRILIATQVIEQSLDLDFDFMVSDLAPVDLLIQRIGRLQRHQRGERLPPVLMLHAPAWTDTPPASWVRDWGTGTANVYRDHGRLWLSLHMLRRLGHRVRLPRQSRRLVEGVYGPDSIHQIPEALREITTRSEAAASRMLGQAFRNSVSASSAYEADGHTRWDDEQAPSRLADPTTEWVLCCDGDPINNSSARSVVSIRSSALASAEAEPRVKTGPWQQTMKLVATQHGWNADGSDPSGHPITVQYDRTRGIQLIRFTQ